MMSRVVSMVMLVLLAVCAVLASASIAFAAMIHAPIVTYITYDRDADVLAFDTLSERTIRISRRGIALDYAWSPDGQRLAVLTTDAGPFEAYILIADLFGNEIGRITHTGLLASPIWMPDNETLLFQVYTGIQTQIYSAQISTPNDWQLVLDVRQDIAFYEDLSLSPDGNRLLFTLNDSLYTLNLDGTNLQHIADDASFPSWFPDGEDILFTRYQPQPVMYRVSFVPQMSIQRIYVDGIFGAQGTWLMDGTHIAFTNNLGEDDEIYIMDADGTNWRRLTLNDVTDTRPAWIP